MKSTNTEPPMKIKLTEPQRKSAQAARNELSAKNDRLKACRTRRDELIALGDESRQTAASIVTTGAPAEDADVTKLLIEERRAAWCEVALETAQLEMNQAGEGVRDAVRPAADAVSRALGPVLQTLLDENIAHLTPMLGEHAARAAANDALPVRKLRGFLSSLPLATIAQAGDLLRWLDNILAGELPAELAE